MRKQKFNVPMSGSLTNMHKCHHFPPSYINYVHVLFMPMYCYYVRAQYLVHTNHNKQYN